MLDGAREAGLLDGIGIPLHSYSQAIAGIGAASSIGGIKLNQYALSLASVTPYQLYNCYVALAAKNRTISRAQFSNREIEILKCLSTSDTKIQIADKLRLTKHTVDYHIRNILIKINTPNTTAAVCKAIRYGYLIL